MYYEFYIDQFFAEQLLVGYLLLSADAALCRKTISRRRLLLGSLAGAAGMTALVCLNLPQLYPATLLAAAGGAFWKKNLWSERKYNLRLTAGLLIITVAFGGALEGLLAILHLPLMLAALLTLRLLRGILYLYRRHSRDAACAATVILVLEGKNLQLKGLLDTGNHLREPMTGRPVSVADAEALTGLLDAGWEEKQGFCLIPYHSLGTEKGWMRGITLDEMRIETERGSLQLLRPLIALYEGQVSAHRSYQVILHPEHAP